MVTPNASGSAGVRQVYLEKGIMALFSRRVAVQIAASELSLTGGIRTYADWVWWAP